MDFYREIQELSEKELDLLIENKIKELEIYAKKENHGFETIGYKLDLNPENYHILEREYHSFDIEVRCFYANYIPIGTKMVYGMVYNNNGIASNAGDYYYIDDDKYIYDFCKYIKEKEIIDEYELFEYILEFMRSYFKILKIIDREKMFQMISKEQRNLYYPTIQEHGFHSFKGKGNAMCSEYAIMAQNLLSILDIDSYLVIGKEKTGNSKEESHAFNLASFIEEKSQEPTHILIDLSNFTIIHDVNFKKIGETPYIMYLPEINQEFVNKLIEEEMHLEEEDYGYMVLENEILKMGYGRSRNYYVDGKITPEDTRKVQKKLKYRNF